MNGKLKVIYVLVVIILISALGWLVWWGVGKLKSNDEQARADQVLDTLKQAYIGAPRTGDTDKVNTPVKVDIAQEIELTPEEIEEHKLQRIALSFASVFGSYSNQSDFENMRDLKYFMTDSMKAWVDKYIAERSGGEIPGSYFGVTTKALEAKVSNLNNNSVEVVVYAQRTESTQEVDSSKIYYQYLEMNLVKVGGAWKVNSAYWK